MQPAAAERLRRIERPLRTATGPETKDQTMPTVTLQDAQSRLPDLIHNLSPGDELVITENNQPVARLSRTEPKTRWPCQAGSARGKIRIAPDFDAPLEEFREYME
jgi:antitoxin (DNA-binding transcriptional repressor) of toxin-antitoxin stability system